MSKRNFIGIVTPACSAEMEAKNAQAVAGVGMGYVQVHEDADVVGVPNEKLHEQPSGQR